MTDPATPPSAPSSTAMADDEHSDAMLRRFLSLHPESISLSLDRIERLLAALGHPERRLPKVVHVAGTNGKGSVAAYLRAGLEASETPGGARAPVHVYTSPHLTRFHERIRLAGAVIDETRLASALRRAEEANAGAPITYFEITTAAALLAFAETPADWCVLEVGLGGRLDATNVVARPAATVITPISLDHRDYLGDTIAKIAAEKAGVLKSGAPCVVAAQSVEAASVIRAAAAKVGAPLIEEGADWSVRLENGRLVYEDAEALLDLPAPRLLGRHQLENAGVAVAALRTLGISEERIAAAMTEVEWPARLQRLRAGPLVDAAPYQVELWLDGGHNQAAAEALAEHMADREEAAPSPLYLICGMVQDKDPEAFLKPFQGLARRVYAMRIPDEPASLSAEAMAEAAVRVGLQTQTIGSIEGALRGMTLEVENDLEDPTPRVLICGSLRLAGWVLKHNH